MAGWVWARTKVGVGIIDNVLDGPMGLLSRMGIRRWEGEHEMMEGIKTSLNKCPGVVIYLCSIRKWVSDVHGALF